jgi:hypothetical protein
MIEKITAGELKKLVKQRLVAEGVEATTTGVNRVLSALVDEVEECVGLGYRLDLLGLATLDFKYVKPIKKGTSVFNPGTQQMQPSQGRAAKLGAKATAGPIVKKALPGLTTKAGKEVAAAITGTSRTK